MTVIGLTGPTGAGKTTALEVLAGMGAVVLDCDRLYHALLERDGEMRKELTQRFGRGILKGTGGIDTKALGRMVFADPLALEALNAIAHRYVCQAVKAALEQAEAEEKSLAAIDAIALLESGLGGYCNAVVGVLAPETVRVRRIMERDGVDEEYARLRVRAQKGEDFYRAGCTHILENSGEETREAFAARAGALFAAIIKNQAGEKNRTD